MDGARGRTEFADVFALALPVERKEGNKLSEALDAPR